jgi:FKBP-type peptidyl-prolyl cis-trans isomerase
MHQASRSLVLLTLGLIAGCRTNDRGAALGAPAPPSEAARAAEAAVPGKAPPEAETSPSGLAFQVLTPGVGEDRPGLHDKVRVEFVAWSTKGPFDSSKKSGGTGVFDMKGVIAGWTEALSAMRVGERRRLWIPDALAYPGLRANPTISVFEVALLEIIRGKAPLPAPPELAAAPADATRTSSGLAYKFLSRGSGGDRPNVWDRVKLHYTGWSSDGTMLETSSHAGRPSAFDVSNVMPGWQEALPLMAAGDRARVWLSAALAGRDQTRGPERNVVYDLELVSVERLPEPPRAPTPLAAAPKDARKTKTGLGYRIQKQGAGGTRATANDRVVMAYSAWTTDGKLFDSTLLRGKPASLPVSGLIPGWAEGLRMMAKGDKATFWIPEKLAYAGRDGSPRGMLVYQVELLDIHERSGASHPAGARN